MGFLDNIRTWLVQPVFDRWGMVDAEMQRRLFELALQREYVAGNQRPQLPVKAGKPDDNIAVNLIAKVVEKSVSLLVGGEVRFDLGEGNEEKQEWLDALWERNRKPIFLKKLAKTSATNGTGYIKIVPDGSEDMNIRLISLPPIAMRIITPPTDPETVLEYQQYWMAEDERGKQRVYRERTVKNEAGWTIINEVEGNGAKWEQLSSIEWDYPFAPIVHGQNLPVDGSPYGDSDVSGVIGLQDRINYVASNISKIIRYHAHPRTIGKGFRVGGGDSNVVVNGEPVGGGEPAEMAGDQMFILPNAEGDVWNLEMQSDLASSMAYLQFLIQSLYDITATVNMSNIKDKLGQLTNFAIQVLYQDAMEKLQDKRDLFGEMLREVNRRLLVLQYGDDDESGGKVIWPPDVTPQNSREEAEELTMDLNNGLVSHQTASHLRGYDWDVEQERMVDERAQTDGELGAQLLAAFNRGQ